MDLFSEFQQAESTINTDSLPYENLKNEQKNGHFRQALTDCTSKIDSECPCHHMLYEDTYVLTGFSSGVLTPFSHIVGTHKNKVVIMSNKVEDTPLEVEGSPLNEAAVTVSERQQEVFQVSYKPPFTVVKRTWIATSFQIQQKYVYLTSKEPVLSESPTFSMLVDLGAKPIPIDTARYFCSMYAISCHGNKNAKDMPELWILCDNSSIKNTVAMGCTVETVDSSRQKLNIIEIQEGKPIVIPDSKSYSISLESNFNGRISLRKPFSDRKRQSYISCTYEFSPFVDDDNDDLFNSSSNPIFMEFIWNGVDACFSPPPVTAEAVLGVSVTPGYQFSPVLGVYAEIESLLHFSEIVIGARSWPSEEEDEEREDIILPSSPLSSKVGSFLDEASSQMFRAAEVSVISPTTELSPFQPREDLDFLGQLWIFARHITSSAELVEIFGLVFRAVLLGHVQPFIHPGNTGTIATLFRQSLSCASNDERSVIATKLQSLLTEGRALQCLVEIGVEKLQRDYLNFLTSNGLSTGNEVEVFFSCSELFEKCKNLCKLHYVLELAAVLVSFVTLPKSFVASFVKHIIQYYRETDFEKFTTTPLFQIPFPALSPALKNLVQFASTFKPSRMSASSEESNPKTGKLYREKILCTSDPLFKYMHCPNTPSSQNADTVMCTYHAFCQPCIL